MAELILEPYTARLHFRLLHPEPGLDWNRVVAGVLETLADRCEVDGQSIIGHIKGLATFAGGGFLRANVVAPSQPADVAGLAPPGCLEMVFTVNVLVYGLTYAAVAARVAEVAGVVTRRGDVAITVEPVVDDHAPHHHH